MQTREIYTKNGKCEDRDYTITIEKFESTYGDIFVMKMSSEYYPHMEFHNDFKAVSFNYDELIEYTEKKFIEYFEGMIYDEDLPYEKLFEQNSYKLLTT